APPQQYLTASPPGVAVSLPGAPAYPGTTAAPHRMPAAPAQPSAPAPAPAPASAAKAKPNPNADQLLPGAGKTVYEFGGVHSEEARAGGKHKTFFADGSELASVAVVEERQHSNLRGGGASFMVAGLVVVVVGGLVAFFLMADSGSKDAEPT